MKYIDLIVLAGLIIFVIIYGKRFQTYMFGFGMIDIAFRILNIIKSYIPSKDIVKIINKYVPGSIPDVIDKYTKDLDMVQTALTLIYVIIMAIFLYYVIRIFIKRKKI